MSKHLQPVCCGIICTLSTFFLVVLIDLSPEYISERNGQNKCAEGFLADATEEMETVLQRREINPGMW